MQIRQVDAEISVNRLKYSMEDWNFLITLRMLIR